MSCPLSCRKRDHPGTICAEGPDAILAGKLLSLHRLSNNSALQQGGGVDHLQQTYLCVLQTGEKHSRLSHHAHRWVFWLVLNVLPEPQFSHLNSRWTTLIKCFSSLLKSTITAIKSDSRHTVCQYVHQKFMHVSGKASGSNFGVRNFPKVCIAYWRSEGLNHRPLDKWQLHRDDPLYLLCHLHPLDLLSQN